MLAAPGGWIDLLPDENLTGWVRVPVGEPLGKNQWKVDRANRTLICEGDGGHEMLLLDKEYSDFVFQVEWRFTPREGDPRYNSGVYVRNSRDGVIWHQAQTGGGSGGYLFADTLVKGAKQRVNLRPQMKENRVRPAGEWNTYEITCQGPKVSLKVNGEVTSEFTEAEVLKGYVGVEAEGYRIEFCNMRLRPLP